MIESKIICFMMISLSVYLELSVQSDQVITWSDLLLELFCLMLPLMLNVGC